MSSKRKKARFTKSKATKRKLELLSMNARVSASNVIVNENETSKKSANIQLNAVINGENLIIKVISVGSIRNVINKQVDQKQSPYIRGLASILDLRGTRYIGLRKNHLPDRILLTRDLQTIGIDMRQAISKLKEFRSKIKSPKNTFDIERV